MNDDVVSAGFSLNLLLDKTEEVATKMAEDSGHSVRVVSRDGKSVAVTADVKLNRVNLSLVDGVVTSYSMG